MRSLDQKLVVLVLVAAFFAVWPTASASGSAGITGGVLHRNAVLTDGRSPDTKDAAAQAHKWPSPYPQQIDGRSPDTKDAAAQAHKWPSPYPQQIDGRSPDTVDAATAAHTAPSSVIVLDRGGFDWTDAGIGAAGGFAVALVLSGAYLLAQRGRRRFAV